MADHAKDPQEQRTGTGREHGSRDRYRDNDDVRDPIPDDQRLGTRADSKAEARGDARENVGNTARGTAAERTGPDANDPRDRGDDRPRYAQGSE